VKGETGTVLLSLLFIIVIIIPYYKGMGFSARLGLLGFGGASLESFDITREAKYAFPAWPVSLFFRNYSRRLSDHIS